MKKMGRKHRPFFRICAMDKRAPRDGRVIEELGFYDPMCKEKDARALLKAERIDYWLGVGAQASQKCAVLIKKYGSNGTHLEQQQAALERLKLKPQAPEAVAIPLPTKEDETKESPAEEAAGEEAAAATPAAEPAAEETAETTTADTPAEEAKASPEEGPSDEAATEEKSE